MRMCFAGSTGRGIKRGYSQQGKGPRFSFLSSWRVAFLTILVTLSCLVIVWRLFCLQVLRHDALAERAQDQREFFEQLHPKRGQIYIKDGEDNTIPVAVNEDRDLVYVVPKYVEDVEGTVKTLATILSIDETEIRQKLEKKDDLYEIVKRKLTDGESAQIKEKKMKGVGLTPESWRNYPEGELASQIIGFVGYRDDKRVGQYGIEGYFNDILEGESGFVKAEKDTAGRWISIGKRTMERPRNGSNIVLTIDQTVQYFTENLLKESIEKYGAEKGSIIVMDPISGKIIAMANFPSYNANEFNKVENGELLKNNCIGSQYEPGSVFKPFTASIPIDLGRLNPDSLYTDTGEFKSSGYTIRNSDLKAHGEITLTRFLELSLNTGAIWAMQESGQDNFARYVRNFGFGKKTGIELIGEATGNIQNLDTQREINFATASFGQGVSFTPLQLVTGFSSLVNGGKLMKPQIVDRIILSDGKEEVIEPEETRDVIDARTSAKIKAMLVSVVKNGWGKKAAVPGYLIGGKTGTAQVPNPDGPGYSDKTVHTFIGFGPANDPRFATIVKLDHVSATRFAEASSTPVTGKLNKFLLDYYHIHPTEEIKPQELLEFNRLMELKREDIEQAASNSTEGAEGIIPINNSSPPAEKKDSGSKEKKEEKNNKEKKKDD